MANRFKRSTSLLFKCQVFSRESQMNFRKFGFCLVDFWDFLFQLIPKRSKCNESFMCLHFHCKYYLTAYILEQGTLQPLNINLFFCMFWWRAKEYNKYKHIDETIYLCNQLTIQNFISRNRIYSAKTSR